MEQAQRERGGEDAETAGQETQEHLEAQANQDGEEEAEGAQERPSAA